MAKAVQIKIEKGVYLFKLRQLLECKGISINKLMRDTDTDFNVIKRFMDGKSARIDLTVLARFCDYLDCGILDILEYVRDLDV